MVVKKLFFLEPAFSLIGSQVEDVLFCLCLEGGGLVVSSFPDGVLVMVRVVFVVGRGDWCWDWQEWRRIHYSRR